MFGFTETCLLFCSLSFLALVIVYCLSGSYSVFNVIPFAMSFCNSFCDFWMWVSHIPGKRGQKILLWFLHGCKINTTLFWQYFVWSWVSCHHPYTKFITTYIWSLTPLDLHLKVITVPSMQCSINIDNAVEFFILVGLVPLNLFPFSSLCCLICDVGSCCETSTHKQLWIWIWNKLLNNLHA